MRCMVDILSGKGVAVVVNPGTVGHVGATTQVI